MLNIKAVLRIKDGAIEPFAKARGARAAYQQLAAHVAQRSRELHGVKAIVIHAVAPDLADELSHDLADAGLVGEITRIGDIGSVIGTHAGPRSVGVCFSPLG